jgi:ABC-2 type transport system permease protein
VTAAVRLLAQVRDEQRCFWRNPAAAFFTFVFPLALLIIFGLVLDTQALAVLGPDLTFPDYLVPSLLAFALMTTSFLNLASVLVMRRDAGVLKRLRATPMPPSAFLAGLVGSSLVVAALLTLVVLALGATVFDITGPRAWGPFLLTAVVGVATFCILGMAVTPALPNGEAAQTVLNAIFYPLAFISGTFYPTSEGSLVRRFSDLFPVQHFVDAVFATFDPRPAHVSTPWADLGVLALWAAVGVAVAVTRFDWSPKRTR